MAWLYVPGTEDWSSGFSLSSETPIAPFVTSSGKPTPQPLLWHGWKRRRWIEHLSGTISRPSTAARSADSWISSLRATRANPSASPERSAAPTTPVICGRTSDGSTKSPEPQSSGSRTSAITCESDSTRYAENYSSWVAKLQQAYSARRKAARRIAASGSSRSPSEGTAWTTPCSADTGGRGTKYAQGGTPLSLQAEKSWPTPNTSDGSGLSGGNRETSLRNEVRAWPTPRAIDGDKGGKTNEAMRQNGLPMKAQTWPTPRGNDSEDVGNHESPTSHPGDSLGARARIWATPQARDTQGAPAPDFNRASLVRDAMKWATPTTRDSKDSPGQTVPTNGLLGRQVLKIALHGDESSRSTRKLNPLFDEWLMGWPIGWTCACRRRATPTGTTGCTGAGTESFRLWRRTHSGLLRALCSRADV